MKKIAAMGLFTDPSQGDPLIHRTVKELYTRCSEEKIEWKDVNFRFFFEGLPRKFAIHVAKKLFYKVKRLAVRFNSKFLYNVQIKILAYCMAQHCKGCDGVLLVGGGLIHYKFHDYWITISASLLACKKLNIPMLINAIGVEGFDEKDPKCQLLSKYMRVGSLRFISTRDDVTTLKEKYLKGDTSVYVTKVIDPVIFCSKLFDVKVQKEGVVGVGLFWKNFMKKYREKITVADLRKYYIDVVEELERRNIRWEFFTNGLETDTDLIPDLEEHFKRKFEVRIPHDTDEFMSMIASYRGIITARMHGCITAYSFDVPAVAYNWVEKVGFWFQNIHHPERTILLDNLDGSMAVQRFLTAEKEGYEADLRKELEENHLKSIKKALEFIR